MLKVAEVARCRRYDEIVNERFGIIDQRKQNGDFHRLFAEIG